MPYKDKQDTAKAMREYRQRQKGITGGITDNAEGITPEHSVYQCITSSKRQVTPTLLNALVDPIERQKLEAICGSLATRNKMDRVYYGISGLTMADISSLLEATDIVNH